MFWLVYINVQKITHLAQNVKYFSYSLDDSFSQLSKEVRLLCWDSRKSKQRKWSDVFQKIQVDINFILICGTKLRTFKQKVRPQWILLWCIFMWKKLGTNLSTPWKIYCCYMIVRLCDEKKPDFLGFYRLNSTKNFNIHRLTKLRNWAKYVIKSYRYSIYIGTYLDLFSYTYVA